MLYWIANVLILGSAVLDIYAVYRQIHKTLVSGHSKDVSTAFFGTKVAKDLLGIVALVTYQNWAGLALLIPGFIAYLVAYVIIIKHKPDCWRPNRIEKCIRRIV